MKTSPYGSVIVALVTPFSEDMSVDYGTARMLAARLTAEGCDGVVVSGTTGESPTLTVAERLRLLNEVKDAVGPDVRVWAGASGYNTKESVELTHLSEKAGADGILAVTPYYNKPSQQGLYLHFRAMSEETALPVMLYNVPGRTSVNMLPETVLRLAEMKNIVAVKEASGNLDQASQILASCPETFYVFSGDDSLTLPILSVGGSGIVSVAAHIVARALRSMVDSYREGDLDKAQEVHLRLYKLFKVLFITTNPVPVKTALELCGTPVGGFRLPLCPPSEREKAHIARVLVELGLIRDPEQRS
ncbi:MAG: 4-hydroxy-tetrahydrodipicolinate synthase [Bacillota bacterium]